MYLDTEVSRRSIIALILLRDRQHDRQQIGSTSSQDPRRGKASGETSYRDEKCMCVQFFQISIGCRSIDALNLVVVHSLHIGILPDRFVMRLHSSPYSMNYICDILRDSNRCLALRLLSVQ